MLRLVEIDQGNWRLPLSVAPEQAHYVCDRISLMARAYAYRQERSRAYFLYSQDTPVGMALYYDCPSLDSYILSQLFIDRRFQRKGYGLEAANLVVQAMRQERKYPKVTLCYVEGDIPAQKLYEKLGFVETGQDEDEIIMELKL